MFDNSRFARIRQMFAEQFEPDGKGFLYRQRSKGAPIPVSAEERAAFIKTFNTHLRHVSWAAGIGGLALAAVHYYYAAQQSDVLFYAGLAVSMTLYGIAFFRVWNAPLRALRERSLVGEPRTEAQVRHLRLGRVSYGQIFIGIAISLIIPFRMEGDWMSGWNPMYLLVSAVSATALLSIAYMKCRAASDHAADTAGPVWRR